MHHLSGTYAPSTAVDLHYLCGILNLLSKARITEINMPQIDMNQVLANMDTIVEKYPMLMDKQTTISVLDILHSNSNLAENKKILEVLKIEADTKVYDYEDFIT